MKKGLVGKHSLTNLRFHLLDEVADSITRHSGVNERSNLGMLCISCSAEPISGLAHENWFSILSDKELNWHSESDYNSAPTGERRNRFIAC